MTKERTGTLMLFLGFAYMVMAGAANDGFAPFSLVMLMTGAGVLHLLVGMALLKPDKEE